VNDLPAKYAALIAKRPELAVERLNYLKSANQWWRESQITGTHRTIPSDEAEAMIESHLLRMLPSGCRTLVVSGRWQVRDTVHATNTDWFDTPLEALIAFYMEDRKP
jgi:hypothetical protein